MSLYEGLMLSYDMHSFTEFASYQNLKLHNLDDFGILNKGKKFETYVPLMDPTGPYFFFPPHCHPKDNKLWDSPIIGYFSEGN